MLATVARLRIVQNRKTTLHRGSTSTIIEIVPLSYVSTKSIIYPEKYAGALDLAMLDVNTGNSGEGRVN